MKLLNKINHEIDMFVYRIFFWRWKKVFKNNPRMLVPFMDTMTRWANSELSQEEIEEETKNWRNITKS